MVALIDWLELLVRVGMGIGLVVFCALRAKRVGGGAYLLGSLGAVNVLLTIAFRAMSHISFESVAPILVGRTVDALFTAIAAILVFVGCILLR